MRLIASGYTYREVALRNSTSPSRPSRPTSRRCCASCNCPTATSYRPGPPTAAWWSDAAHAPGRTGHRPGSWRACDVSSSPSSPPWPSAPRPSPSSRAPPARARRTTASSCARPASAASSSTPRAAPSTASCTTTGPEAPARARAPRAWPPALVKGKPTVGKGLAKRKVGHDPPRRRHPPADLPRAPAVPLRGRREPAGQGHGPGHQRLRRPLVGRRRQGPVGHEVRRRGHPPRPRRCRPAAPATEPSEAAGGRAGATGARS